VTQANLLVRRRAVTAMPLSLLEAEAKYPAAGAVRDWGYLLTGGWGGGMMMIVVMMNMMMMRRRRRRRRRRRGRENG
jgi:hypothetical protein